MKRSPFSCTAAKALLLLMGLAGCKPSYRDVRVDVDRLARQDLASAPKPAVIAVPPTPSAIPASTDTFPPVPAETISDPSRASKGAVAARAESQQEESLIELQKGLQELDEAKVRAFWIRGSQDLAATIRGQNDALIPKIQTMFAQYAEKRAPKVMRFAMIVGYPDPNPTSAPPRGPVKPYVQARYAEAKQIREDLAALDRGFEEATDQLIETEKGVSEKLKEQLAQKVQDYRRKLDHDAAALAAREVKTSAKELGLKLVDPTPVKLPAIPARNIQLPAEPAPMAAPKVPSELIARGVAERRALLEHQLDIWLALNRYRRAPDGRDATQEFQAWRETYRGGL